MEEKIVTKSRFFTENVRQVAGVCWKCYQECEDVKIKAMNSQFLNKSEKNYFKCPNTKYTNLIDTVCCLHADKTSQVKQECDNSGTKEEVDFKGYSDRSINKSSKICKNKYTVTSNFKKRKYKEVKVFTTKNNHFKGFSKNDMDESLLIQDKYSSITGALPLTLNSRTHFTQLYSNVFNNIANKKYSEKYNDLSKSYSKTQSKTNLEIEKNSENTTIKKESPIIKKEFIKVEIEQIDGKATIDPDYKKLEEIKHNFKNEFVKTEDDQKIQMFIPKIIIPKREDGKWHPPRSPHNLIEEILYDNPWALFVATIFLNKTSCMCARPYILQFLQDYPHPCKVLKTSPNQLESYFHNLGLKKRSVQIWKMTHDYVYKNWKHPKELFGIGKYGEDSYRMFCLGDFNVEPKDRFLRIYKAWYEMTEDHKKKGIVGEHFSVNTNATHEMENCSQDHCQTTFY